MATCGSLRPLFEKRPMAENPALMDSLSSWNQIKPMQPEEQPSFTEFFGELHFKEKPDPHAAALPLPSPPQPTSPGKGTPTTALDPKMVSSDHPRMKGERDQQGRMMEPVEGKLHNQFFIKPVAFDIGSLSPASPADQHGPGSKAAPSPIFTPKNSESLHLCTEGLGFESSDDMEDSRSESGFDWSSGGGGGGGVEEDEEVSSMRQPPVAVPSPRVFQDMRGRSGTGKFPPPISVIGSSGKPWVCFKAYKGDGRFVLKEVRIPTYEFLHASREDGRLKLHLIQPEEMEEQGMELEGVDAGEEEHPPKEHGGNGKTVEPRTAT